MNFSHFGKPILDVGYILRLSKLERLASDLLGMQFHGGRKNYRTHIGARFVCINRLHLECDYNGRDVEMIKLFFLFKHLQELRQINPDAYTRARRSVRKAPDESQYFGTRMEVYVAASLARAGIKFRCRESPDYELLDEYRNHFIECGSAHITGTSTDTVKKIALVVASKCKKKYAKRDTALFLDATNAIQRGIGANHPYSTDQLRIGVHEVIKDAGYGSVLLFSYGLNHDIIKITAGYIRIDAQDIEPDLLHFMERIYPFGHVDGPTFYLDQG